MVQDSIQQSLRRYVPVVGLYLFGPLFFVWTNPAQLPLVALIIPFLWVFSTLFVTSYLLLRRLTAVTKRKRVMVSGIIATIPVLLLVFQSIHQLSFRDVLLAVAIALLAAVYMMRADFIR